MARDLFLGETNTSWSRGECNPTTSGYNGHLKFIRGEVSDEVTLQLTDDEKAMLQRIVAVKSRAEAGDEAAKKQLAQAIVRVASLKAAAQKGDARAKRRLLVLRESGIFRRMRKLDVSGALFKDDPHAKDRRAERYEAEVNKISNPEQIEDLAKIVAFNPEYREHTKNLVARGNTTARKILDASEKYAAGTTSRIDLPKTILRGDLLDFRTPSSEIQRRVKNMKADLQKLRQKKPRTDEDRRTMDALEEHIARSEAVSGEAASGESASGLGESTFVGRHRRHRDRSSDRSNRQQRLASLKTRAAAGDQAAVAKLAKLQTRLTTELSTLNTPATTTTTPTTAPPVIPGTTTPSFIPGTNIPSTVPGAPPAIPPYGTTSYPTTYPTGYPAAYPQGYPTYQPQYAYQSPYYDPGTMDPYGPAPQPTVDVYQGSATQGEEDAALACEAGGAERAALIRSGRMDGSRGSFVGGLAIPNPVYRATIQKYARRHADGKNPTTRDIFLAKAAVDKAMGRAGVGLYMPGAQPGRRTI
jgi:hypothetical protein